MELITLPSPEPKSNATMLAEEMLCRLNGSLAERVHDHRVGFAKFWDSPETPDDIIAAMESNAGVLLAAAGENVEHIGRLAAIVGKTVLDFLPADHWTPRREIIIAEDGTGTIAPPAEGYDAWGRLILVFNPEPLPE